MTDPEAVLIEFQGEVISVCWSRRVNLFSIIIWKVQC